MLFGFYRPPVGWLVAQSTVQALSQDEMADPEVQAQFGQLDVAIHKTIGDTILDDEIDPEL